MLRFPVPAIRQEVGASGLLAEKPSQRAKLIWDLPLLERIGPSFWTEWAKGLKDVRSGEKLQTCSDLELVELPERTPLVVDPVINTVIGRRCEPRQQAYFRTMGAWAHDGLRPMSERQARALWAWSAAVSFSAELIDGWDVTRRGLDVGPSEADVPKLDTLIESRRALILAIERNNGVFRFPVCTASPQLWDAVRVLRRASNLCFGLRPSEGWWEDYRREMALFVHRRIARLIQNRRMVETGAKAGSGVKAGLGVNPGHSLERCLRSRAMDLGCPVTTVVTGLSQGVYPTWSSEITGALAEVQALSWLHRIAVTDLYSYSRSLEGGEGQGNLLQTVMTVASQGTAPALGQRVASTLDQGVASLGQGVDRVVCLANRVWNEFQSRVHPLEASLEGRRSSGLRGHLQELGHTMMGNLEFIRGAGALFQDPSPPDRGDNPEPLRRTSTLLFEGSGGGCWKPLGEIPMADSSSSR